MKGRDAHVLQHAREYLEHHERFCFSIITRYEILRGLKAKGAEEQARRFQERCLDSDILPLSDTVVVQAAEVYAKLRRSGELINDADILIGATALVNDLVLVTENPAHFERISGLVVTSWRSRLVSS